VLNLVTGILFSVLLLPSNISNSCNDYVENHPVRSDIMMQVVLKSYGYYEGKIDGIFGNVSKQALISLQKSNNIEADGKIGPQTCTLLLNKQTIVKKKVATTENISKEITNPDKTYSQEIYDAQIILKNLGLYLSTIDGINGPGTKRAVREFQTKAGLISDGVIGSKTKAALSKGEDSYIKTADVAPTTSNTSQSSTETTTYGLDLRNYDPSKTCIDGYVDSNGIWVPDPCFKPVFVYRFGKTAQVNSQNELDAYLAERWSLEKEKTYVTIGRVKTQNYTDGINSPVNGLVMPSGANNKIVIGIKNDNNVRARPQSGPQNADAVVEVLVEGGMTRLINIFYESDTSYHGPIRSARPTDPTVLRPLDGVLVASGATGGLIPEIIDMGVPVITDRRPEFFRISSRSAPHNLYADTYKLKNLAISKGYKKTNNPQPLFPWGNPNINSWANGKSIKLKFSSATTTTWTWNGSNYVRTYYDAYKGSSSDNPHYWINENGSSGQIAVPTVIALMCEPYMHPLQLPSVKTVGEGRAIIMHGGKMLDAKWKRGSNLDPFHIVDSNGNTLYIPKGKPWISLVPNTFSPTFDN
jgi:peptidoglycan hydrolase-like protein with peptidoglycan-binding domain